MPGIGVISNRNARLNRLKPGLKDQLAFVIGSNGKVDSTGSLDDVHKVIELFRRVSVDVIAISGGDGTSHRTLEILMEVYKGAKLPAILILPTGTMNMIPRALGIEGSGLQALLLAVTKYQHNIPLQCVKRNMLMVNGHTSFMFATGLATRFMKYYYECGEVNAKGASKLMAGFILDYLKGGNQIHELVRNINTRITVDGKILHEEIPLSILFCSFMERLPMHFVLFPRSGMMENTFEFVYGAPAPGKLCLELPNILIGKHEQDSIHHILAKEMIIELEEPEVYTLDGDLYEPTNRFEITHGPELEFIIPNLTRMRRKPHLRYSEIGPWSMRYLL